MFYDNLAKFSIKCLFDIYGRSLQCQRIVTIRGQAVNFPIRKSLQYTTEKDREAGKATT